MNSYLSKEVALLGVNSLFGKTTSALLKKCPCLSRLTLYDDQKVNVLDEVDPKATSCELNCIDGRENMSKAIKSADIIIIGDDFVKELSHESIFLARAPMVSKYAQEIAIHNPNAMIVVATTPVNMTVPLVAETLKYIGKCNEKKVFGMTNVENWNARCVLATYLKINPHTINFPVIGGSSSETRVPLFSKIYPHVPLNKSTLQKITCAYKTSESKLQFTKAAQERRAYATSKLTESLVAAMSGQKVIETVLSRQNIIRDTDYFSLPVVLGKDGIEKHIAIPNISQQEQYLLSHASKCMAADAKKAIVYSEKNKDNLTRIPSTNKLNGLNRKKEDNIKSLNQPVQSDTDLKNDVKLLSKNSDLVKDTPKTEKQTDNNSNEISEDSYNSDLKNSLNYQKENMIMEDDYPFCSDENPLSVNDFISNKVGNEIRLPAEEEIIPEGEVAAKNCFTDKEGNLPGKPVSGTDEHIESQEEAVTDILENEKSCSENKQINNEVSENTSDNSLQKYLPEQSDNLRENSTLRACNENTGESEEKKKMIDFLGKDKNLSTFSLTKENDTFAPISHNNKMKITKDIFESKNDACVLNNSRKFSSGCNLTENTFKLPKPRYYERNFPLGKNNNFLWDYKFERRTINLGRSRKPKIRSNKINNTPFINNFETAVDDNLRKNYISNIKVLNDALKLYTKTKKNYFTSENNSVQDDTLPEKSNGVPSYYRKSSYEISKPCIMNISLFKSVNHQSFNNPVKEWSRYASSESRDKEREDRSIDKSDSKDKHIEPRSHRHLPYDAGEIGGAGSETGKIRKKPLTMRRFGPEQLQTVKRDNFFENVLSKQKNEISSPVKNVSFKFEEFAEEFRLPSSHHQKSHHHPALYLGMDSKKKRKGNPEVQKLHLLLNKTDKPEVNASNEVSSSDQQSEWKREYFKKPTPTPSGMKNQLNTSTKNASEDNPKKIPNRVQMNESPKVDEKPVDAVSKQTNTQINKEIPEKIPVDNIIKEEVNTLGKSSDVYICKPFQDMQKRAMSEINEKKSEGTTTNGPLKAFSDNQSTNTPVIDSRIKTGHHPRRNAETGGMVNKVNLNLKPNEASS